MRLNLHTHSVKSDGVFTPAQVVDMQAADNIEVMSLTDHDSIAGIDEAIAEGERTGIKVIAGIELSSSSVCEIHVLGYNFDYKNPEFGARLNYIKDLRKTRISKTVARLRELGVNFDDTKLDFENGNLGRVHVARQMVEQGISSNVSDAFYRYLGAGKRAYIEGYRLRPMEAVKLIKDFGGVAVLAHPVYIQKDKLELLVAGLVPYGLDGLECYYSSHNETDTARFINMAKKYRLITTAGTDLHDGNMYISQNYRCDLVDNESLKKLGLLK